MVAARVTEGSLPRIEDVSLHKRSFVAANSFGEGTLPEEEEEAMDANDGDKRTGTSGGERRKVRWTSLRRAAAHKLVSLLVTVSATRFTNSKAASDRAWAIVGRETLLS